MSRGLVHMHHALGIAGGSRGVDDGEYVFRVGDRRVRVGWVVGDYCFQAGVTVTGAAQHSHSFRALYQGVLHIGGLVEVTREHQAYSTVI